MSSPKEIEGRQPALHPWTHTKMKCWSREPCQGGYCKIRVPAKRLKCSPAEQIKWSGNPSSVPLWSIQGCQISDFSPKSIQVGRWVGWGADGEGGPGMTRFEEPRQLSRALSASPSCLPGCAIGPALWRGAACVGARWRGGSAAARQTSRHGASVEAQMSDGLCHLRARPTFRRERCGICEAS